LEGIVINILFEFFLDRAHDLLHRTILFIFLNWRRWFLFDRRLFWNRLHFNNFLIHKFRVIWNSNVESLSLIASFISICRLFRSFWREVLHRLLSIIIVLHLRHLI
jgi:hypothetical protein